MTNETQTSNDAVNSTGEVVKTKPKTYTKYLALKDFGPQTFPDKSLSPKLFLVFLQNIVY